MIELLKPLDLTSTYTTPLITRHEKTVTSGDEKSIFSGMRGFTTKYPKGKVNTFEETFDRAVEFAIQRHEEGCTVTAQCTNDQEGIEACKYFANEIIALKPDIINYTASDYEL